MPSREIFEECVQFISDIEGRESELELATKMGTAVEEDQLYLMVIHKLKHGIELVQTDAYANQQPETLYHIALYANAVGKPRFGISLCYIAINHSEMTEKYLDLAKHLLTEIKLKLPEDIYNNELQQTTLDVEAALDRSYKWLTKHERHATQPPTKQVFNSDLIKKYQNKNAKS